MPKDQWRAANNRARYGPVVQEKRRLPEWIKTFTIPAGARCYVRKAGAVKWRRHTTTRTLVCAKFTCNNGDHYRFIIDDWEVDVPVGSFHINERMIE